MMFGDVLPFTEDEDIELSWQLIHVSTLLDGWQSALHKHSAECATEVTCQDIQVTLTGHLNKPPQQQHQNRTVAYKNKTKHADSAVDVKPTSRLPDLFTLLGVFWFSWIRRSFPVRLKHTRKLTWHFVHLQFKQMILMKTTCSREKGFFH